MEKIKRKVRLFWVQYGKLFLQAIGIIAAIIFVIQFANEIVKLENEAEEERLIATQEEREKEKKKQEKIDDDEKVISEFIEYCNNKQIEEAYNMLTENCKKNYPTVKNFEEKYVNKIFKTKMEFEIDYQENNTYKIILLEDILQAGTIDARRQIEDYYSIKEDVFKNKTIDINLYNNI